MEALLPTPSATYLSLKTPKMMTGNGIRVNYIPCSIFAHGSSSFPFFGHNLCVRPRKSVSVIVGASKKDKKEDSHSFIPKPDEATWFFPEAALLKEKKVELDSRVLPDFEDEEEKELFDSLLLELESETNVDQRRHYEVVYLIHEKHADEVATVNEKVRNFLREKKGKVWRMTDWGMRELAYAIKKAKSANYILMNFEVDAKYINEFKNLLDKDERIIRHLVIKRDEAITEDCPPPPEFRSLRPNIDEEETDSEYDDEDSIDEIDDYDDDDDEEIVIASEDGHGSDCKGFTYIKMRY